VTKKKVETYIVFSAAELDDDAPKDHIAVFFEVEEGGDVVTALHDSGAFGTFMSESVDVDIMDLRVSRLSDIKRATFSLV
jgi:hypothetical protein